MEMCVGSSERRAMRHSGLTGLWLAALVSAILALTIAFVGMTMAPPTSQAEREEPAEVWVIEGDGTEPFVTCTISATVRRCRNLDLVTGQPVD